MWLFVYDSLMTLWHNNIVYLQQQTFNLFAEKTCFVISQAFFGDSTHISSETEKKLNDWKTCRAINHNLMTHDEM